MGKPKYLLIKTIATGFGLGYSPIIPGTIGSFLGFLSLFIPYPLFISIVLFFIGVAISTEVEKLFPQNDPPQIVIDEIVGCMVFLSFVPHKKWYIIVGFVLYRLLDIIKPFPAFRLQQLPGGWGIMLDDLIVGLYTAGIILCIKRFFIW